jgi:hypothetical protein
MPSLLTLREGAVVLAAPDPSDPTKSYVYALGGSDSNESTGASATTEYLPVTIAGDGTQTTAASFISTSNLNAAHWRATGWEADGSVDSAISGSYLYVADGFDVNGTSPVSAAEVAQVSAGGSLGAFSTLPNAPAARAGAVGAAADGTLLMIGGQDSTPSVVASSLACTIGTVPQLSACATSSTSLGTPRYLPGSAQYGGIVYVAGGVSDAGTTLASVEQGVD